jgi:hypothetical protein
MSLFQRILLGCLVPVLSLIYATGEYFEWWEKLSGRKLATQGIERLASPKNYPTICIFSDEEEFVPLLKYITSRTLNRNVIQNYKAGRSPSAVVRVGGAMKPPGFEGNIQLDLPNPDFVPDSSPVVVLYDYSRNDYPKSTRGKMQPIGQLRDLREWIRDCRNTQGFLVAALLIGILSVVVVILDVTRSVQQSKG